jgi:hypothetical protein
MIARKDKRRLAQLEGNLCVLEPEEETEWEEREWAVAEMGEKGRWKEARQGAE